jgi:hypothetical protein
MATDHRAKPGRAWAFKNGCIFTLDGKRSRLVATLHGTPEQREEAARRILAVMDGEFVGRQDANQAMDAAGAKDSPL